MSFVHNIPEEEVVVGVEQALSLSCNSAEREPFLLVLLVALLGFCLRVIVNETYIKLEKTKTSVLSVILINLFLVHS